MTLIGAFVVVNLSQHQVMGFAEFLTMRISVKNVLLIAVLAYCWVALFRSFGLYDVRRLMTWEEEMLRVVAACLLGSLVALIFPMTSVSHAFHFDTTAIFFVGVTVNTFIVRRIGHMLTERGTTGGVRSLVIVGSGPRAQRAYREMCLCDRPQYTCVGFVDSEPVPMNGTPIRMLGGIAELENLLVHEPIDEVLIALPIKSQYAGVQRALRICERVGVQATYLADVFEHGLAKPRFGQAESMAVVTLPMRTDDSRLMVKRGMDIVGAVARPRRALAAPRAHGTRCEAHESGTGVVQAAALRLQSPPLSDVQVPHDGRGRRAADGGARASRTRRRGPSSR